MCLLDELTVTSLLLLLKKVQESRSRKVDSTCVKEITKHMRCVHERAELVTMNELTYIFDLFSLVFADIFRFSKIEIIFFSSSSVLLPFQLKNSFFSIVSSANSFSSHSAFLPIASSASKNIPCVYFLKHKKTLSVSIEVNQFVLVS